MDPCGCKGDSARHNPKRFVGNFCAHGEWLAAAAAHPTAAAASRTVKGLVIGVGTAAMVGLMATVAILGHRHAHDQSRDFDTGFQFEIVLQAPLTLERARVTCRAEWLQRPLIRTFQGGS